MENASKALLIAGGVLIAIILISMFLTMYNRIASSQRSQEEQKEIEQILAFNAEYEAFDKKVMYGADVITIINKAIENNRTKNATTGEINYINIHITVTNTFVSTVEIENMNTKSWEHTQEGTTAANTALSKFGITISAIPLNPGSYDLGTWANGELIENSNIVSWFKDSAINSVDRITKVEKTTINGKQQVKYYYITSGLSDFKTHLFECKNILYDENGRVKDMYFIQK